MKTFENNIKNLLMGIYNAPQLMRIYKLINERPLILKIETVNFCNANCVFCGYSKMKREKKVLSLEIFEKVIHQYSEIGGGAISLNSIVGDPLLDPYLIKRYEIINKYENIDQISFTTNGIAFTKYSDEDLKYILKKSFMIQISIGGLDREVYKNLYRVDQLDNVLSSVSRLLDMKKNIKDDVNVYLAFRTDSPEFENVYSKELDEFKSKGALLSGISSYHNFGGAINSAEVKNVCTYEDEILEKTSTCALPLLTAAVCSDGKITSCSCVDMDADLCIGDARYDSISKCWKGRSRIGIIKSFREKKLYDLCKKCNAYRPSNVFWSHFFKNVHSYSKIPLELYLYFSGG